MVKEEERIFQGIVFCPGDPELVALKLRTHNLNVDYNNTYEDEYEKRAAILGEILGEMGEGTRIQGPIAFHYGKHTKIGRNFFGNFNLTIQDDGEVTIGDRCNFGPNVPIVTPIHPMVPEERNALLGPDGSQAPVLRQARHIGSDVWLGCQRGGVPRRHHRGRLRHRRGGRGHRDVPPVPSPQATPAGSSGKSPNRTAWPTSRRFWQISLCPKLRGLVLTHKKGSHAGGLFMSAPFEKSHKKGVRGRFGRKRPLKRGSKEIK